MSLRYLPEHAENARLALELELARKEAAQLSSRDDLSEKIDAFVSRFGRLQALLSAREATEMLFRTVAALEAEAAALGLLKAERS